MRKMILAISSSPYLHYGETTPWIMFQVVICLLSLVLVSIFYFGLSALLVVLTAVISCMFTEWYFNPGPNKFDSLKDGSALITGILLALTLPPGISLWMVFLGGVVAIGMGKVMWGGLGNNIFNPALLGRAFLQAAFPTAITTFCPPDGGYTVLRGTNLAVPFLKDTVDGMTTATPLSLFKFQHTDTALMDLFVGRTGGSLGETCAALILITGVILIARNLINWRIPAGIFGSVILWSSIFYFYDMHNYPSPIFMLFSGGLMLGTIYMATDMVTSPVTPLGCWIYAIGIGTLTVMIRLFGGLPEGVMYAILVMNAVTPLINKFAKQRVFGTSK
jgi:electron transport complex protein RnfD